MYCTTLRNPRQKGKLLQKLGDSFNHSRRKAPGTVGIKKRALEKVKTCADGWVDWGAYRSQTHPELTPGEKKSTRKDNKTIAVPGKKRG